MDPFTAAGGLLAFALLVYLCLATFRPEMFE